MPPSFFKRFYKALKDQPGFSENEPMGTERGMISFIYTGNLRQDQRRMMNDYLHKTFLAQRRLHLGQRADNIHSHRKLLRSNT